MLLARTCLPSDFGIDQWIPEALTEAVTLPAQMGSPPPSPQYHLDFLSKCSGRLDEAFCENSENVRALVAARAFVVDQVLRDLWLRMDWPEGARASLVAVGGYGRAELFPHSDVDILILVDHEQSLNLARDPLERFIASLWDLKLDVGHSVRTLEDCAEQASLDITIATNLLETRRLAGNHMLVEKLQEQAFSDKICNEKAFFSAKVAEQQDRHERYSDSEYNLEPNIKTSPGGLRDIQTIGWIAKRHFGHPAKEPVRFPSLTDDEQRSLTEAEDYLWSLRYGLQMRARRNENRLLFDHQRGLAELLGFADSNASLGVEKMMKRYYRYAMMLNEINDVLLQHFDEQILGGTEEKPSEVINRRLVIRDGYLEVADPQVFVQSPSTLIEVFLHLAQHPDARGIRAGTIRAIRAHRHLIDKHFRSSLANTTLFMEIFRTPHALHHTLSAMRKYSVLGRYLPEFGRVIGQMQHDLFHVYTVDAHTIRVIRNMVLLNDPKSGNEWPLAHWLMQRIPKPELLYIAGLYHDIAKGRGGDHSELGAEDAERFCRRHHLSDRDTSLIRWLVANHLLMSMTAQRKDLSDPDVIALFADRMDSQTHLDYLYILTVCDISATSPTLWNTWRSALLRQLYTETVRHMRRSTNRPLSRNDWLLATQKEVRDLLRQQRQSPGAIHYTESELESLWSSFDEDFFMQDSTAEIAWQINTILSHKDASTPLVRIKDAKNGDAAGFIKVFVSINGRKDLFLATTATMEQLNLNIVEARMYALNHNGQLAQFVVTGEEYQLLPEDIVSALHSALEQPMDAQNRVTRRIPRQLKFFHFPTEVTFSSDTISGRTMMEVVTPDRPGLLARIAQAMDEHKLKLHLARIVTLGERVEDVFVLTGPSSQPLSDPRQCESLRQRICELLDPEHEPSTLTF